ncbi:MAG: hypothetical protein D6753_15925 [Planctomycetota bacterium]|nr:MAG: hypothetical protein D6753_15925 [Planctomycetota bacterium]
MAGEFWRIRLLVMSNGRGILANSTTSDCRGLVSASVLNRTEESATMRLRYGATDASCHATPLESNFPLTAAGGRWLQPAAGKF